MTSEPEIGRLSVQYPGGLAARFRWGATGTADDVFAISEATGSLFDYGSGGGAGGATVSDSACRAELRVEGPGGAWTARFASQVFDEPQGVLWDTHALLLVKYGFTLFALNGRSGELAWSYVSGTPTVAILASSRIDHVLLQTELETIALDGSGQVVWRAAHSDVITHAQLIAGRIDLTTYSGVHLYLDAQSGQAA